MSTKVCVVGVRILLLLTATYHFVAGVAATFLQTTALKLGAFLFGISVTLTDEMALVVRYLGVFGITLAVLAFFAALDPARNKKIIYGVAVYFFIRAFDRMVFYEAMQPFQIGPAPAWVRIVVILVFGVSFILFSRGLKTTKEENVSA